MPQSAKIEYEVIRDSEGNIWLKKDGGMVKIKDSIENLALLSFIEVDLDYKLKKYPQ